MTNANQLQDTLDFIENPESRIACVMILDVSSSMSGDPIKEVNAGLKAFINQIKANDLTAKRADVSIIAFNHDHDVVLSFGEALDIGSVELRASGQTRMAPPINTALEIIDNRKRQYQEAGISYYRPIVMLLTDRLPPTRFQSRPQRGLTAHQNCRSTEEGQVLHHRHRCCRHGVPHHPFQSAA